MDGRGERQGASVRSGTCSLPPQDVTRWLTSCTLCCLPYSSALSRPESSRAALSSLLLPRRSRFSGQLPPLRPTRRRPGPPLPSPDRPSDRRALPSPKVSRFSSSLRRPRIDVCRRLLLQSRPSRRPRFLPSSFRRRPSPRWSGWSSSASESARPRCPSSSSPRRLSARPTPFRPCRPCTSRLARARSRRRLRRRSRRPTRRRTSTSIGRDRLTCARGRASRASARRQSRTKACGSRWPARSGGACMSAWTRSSGVRWRCWMGFCPRSLPSGPALSWVLVSRCRCHVSF